MSFPSITAKFAAVFLLFLLALSFAVIARRGTTAVLLGDAGDDVLRHRIRAHGNFIEYVPLGLIGLMLSELAGAPVWETWTLGGVLLAGRVLHAASILTGIVWLRPPAMICTFGMMMVCAVRLLARI